MKRLEIGDLVEVDGRRYDVVADGWGGAMLEPAITMTVAEIRAETGGLPPTKEEFEEFSRDIPSDGEG